MLADRWPASFSALGNQLRLYGFHPVREALRSRPHDVRKIWIARGRKGRRPAEIQSLARRHSVAVEHVGQQDLDQLAGRGAQTGSQAGAVHNGFIAELVGVGASPGQTKPGGDADFIVLLEDIQDPRNLGALLRVCEGAGVGKVVIRDRGSAPLSAATVKTSAGAAEWLTIERVTNSANAIEALKKDGYWVYGAEGSGTPPWEVDLKGKIVICLGGEEKGLRARTRKECDALLGLPMQGRVESLNVATAAAALLYEALRQRQS